MPGKRFGSILADWDAWDQPVPGSSYINKYSFCFVLGCVCVWGGYSKHLGRGSFL